MFLREMRAARPARTKPGNYRRGSLTDVRVALKSPCRDVLHAPVTTSSP